MMSPSTLAANTADMALSVGTARSFHAADIHPHKYPLGLELLMEEVINSKRHGATKIDITYREVEEGYMADVLCNSVGDATIERMRSPAQFSGGTTSMYGVGLWITRLKRGRPGDTFLCAWKKSGWDWFYQYSPTDSGTEAKGLHDALSPWKARADRGFLHRTLLRHESLMSAGNIEGVSLSELSKATREILCVHMCQSTIDSLVVTVSVINKAGELVSSIKSNDTRAPWKAFETVCRDRAQSKDTLSLVVSGGRKEGAQDLPIDLEYIRLTKTTDPNFPRWDVPSTSHLFVEVFGFIIPVPLYTALNRAYHPSSMNRRVAFMTPRSADVASRPTPASTRTSFLQTCPVWQECLRKFQEVKPSGWVKWAKEDKAMPPPVPDPVPTPDPAPAPPQGDEWITTPYGQSLRGESERREAEDDKAYLKRIKINRYSRIYKKKTSRSNSVSSGDGAATTVPAIQIPPEPPIVLLPASPAPTFEDEIRTLVPGLTEDVYQRIFASHRRHLA